MNKNFQSVLALIEGSLHLTEEEKKSIIKSIIEADNVLEITAFKLERIEKVKRTMAIVLEETIEELEQKRKAIEEQNKELEIEAALERVRSKTLSIPSGSVLSRKEIDTLSLKPPSACAINWGPRALPPIPMIRTC